MHKPDSRHHIEAKELKKTSNQQKEEWNNMYLQKLLITGKDPSFDAKEFLLLSKNK